MLIRIFVPEAGKKWGLGHDSRLIETVLHQARLSQPGGSKVPWKIDYCDPLSWGNQTTPADIHIYLEMPCRMAMPWARFNIMVVNPEWWQKTAWDWCFHDMDMFLFKCKAAADLFPEITREKRYVLPWQSPLKFNWTQSPVEEHFLYVVGSSKNKFAAARIVVAAWKPTYPRLELWTTPDIAADLRSCVPADCVGLVTFQTDYRSEQDLRERQRTVRWHIVASCAEGFGMTMAEAASMGAEIVWTDLPVYRETWKLGDVGCIPCFPASTAGSETRDPGVTFDAVGVQGAVEGMLAHRSLDYRTENAIHLKNCIQEARQRWTAGWKTLYSIFLKKAHEPRLPGGSSSYDPVVAILTVTRNRAAWWTNMTENVRRQAWPVTKLLWVIVDDSAGMGGRIDSKVEEFRATHPGIRVEYCSLPRFETIGAKRNRGAALAFEQGADVVVCMDDDDYYGPQSISRRVAWLARSDVGAVYCATLPMYDINRYISAMNVPPLTLSPAERVSEATLAFKKKFWQERGFPQISMAEGEGFLMRRDYQTVEIPPYGIIVSFIHKGNSSSRRTPEATEPNGCHYGFSDEYFTYIHTIGGSS